MKQIFKLEKKPKKKDIYKETEKEFFRKEIKHLVTRDIIKEHANNPIGKHSDALEKLLIYLRKHQLETHNKYIIVCSKLHAIWHIGKLSGVRGVPPKIYEEECFNSEKEAEHGIFLKRLSDLNLL